MKKFFERLAFAVFRAKLALTPRPTVARSLTVDYAIVSAWYLANESLYRLVKARFALRRFSQEERTALTQEAMVRVRANKVVETKREARQAKKRRFEGK